MEGLVAQGVLKINLTYDDQDPSQHYQSARSEERSEEEHDSPYIYFCLAVDTTGVGFGPQRETSSALTCYHHDGRGQERATSLLSPSWILDLVRSLLVSSACAHIPVGINLHSAWVPRMYIFVPIIKYDAAMKVVVCRAPVAMWHAWCSRAFWSQSLFSNPSVIVGVNMTIRVPSVHGKHHCWDTIVVNCRYILPPPSSICNVMSL